MSSSSSHQEGIISVVSLLHGLMRSKEHPWNTMNVQYLTQRVAYHTCSLWLFTASDIKTIIAPSLLFALLTVSASAVFGISPAPKAEEVLHRAPIALFWLWINLLPFNIDNQRYPQSISEDAINKPWRTMPSKRMTPEQARTLMLCLYPLALVASSRVGGTQQCISLMLLGFWYNGMQGADESCVIRNLINAAGFNRFATGALHVMLGGSQQRTTTRALIAWEAIVAGIVFTTVQSQDMADQRGDAQRDRRTVPLVIGDGWARWSIAVPMVFWCSFCPAYIGNYSLGYVVSVGLGGMVAARTLLLRSEKADDRTFKLWNFWLVAIYFLPLLKVLEERGGYSGHMEAE